MASEHGCGKLESVEELFCPEVFAVVEVVVLVAVFAVAEVVVPAEVLAVVEVVVLLEDFALWGLLRVVVVVCLPVALVDPQAASTSPIINKAAILRMILPCICSIQKAPLSNIHYGLVSDIVYIQTISLGYDFC